MNTTSTSGVAGLLSSPVVRGVEKYLVQMLGIEYVSVSAVAESATATYDQGRIDPERVRAAIQDYGYHCAGEMLPRHICGPMEHAVASIHAHGRIQHKHPERYARAAGRPVTAKAPVAYNHAAMARGNMDATAHEMGHGPGMDTKGMARDMRNRFWVCPASMVPIFLYAPMGMDFIKLKSPFGLDLGLWLLLPATAAVIYLVWPFFIAAARASRSGMLNMAVLVMLGVGTGYVFSAGSTFILGGTQFYETVSVLLASILLGHWPEMRAYAGASEAIRALMDLAPPKTTVSRTGKEVAVATAEVLLDDIVLVYPGDKVSVDGEVPEGGPQVDESTLTGELMPVEKMVDNKVIGATINRSGSSRYRAIKVGADTALAQIVKLVQEAQNSKAPAQLLTNQASQWPAVVALLIGMATFAVWYFALGQPVLLALILTITVFVIVCPDALGLATPTVVMAGIGLGVINGILSKNAAALEDAIRLNVVIFDKTGTLTLGEPEVVDIAVARDVTPDDLLRVSGSVEKLPEHPLVVTILKRAGTLASGAVTDLTNINGQGIQAVVVGRLALLGNRWLMEANSADLGALKAGAGRLQGQGRTVMHVAYGGCLIGLIAIVDAVRSFSTETIKALHGRGVQVAMLTGDNRSTAERITRELGIGIVLADVLPGDKAAKVRELRGQGKKVGMVDDDVNDAPVLTQADVGSAIGAGTDVVMKSVDVVLMKSDPLDVVGATELSRATSRKTYQNLWRAVAYNIVALPLVASVLYPFTTNPEVAAITMSGSSAPVATSALMLKRTRLIGIRCVSAVAVHNGMTVPVAAHGAG